MQATCTYNSLPFKKWWCYNWLYVVFCYTSYHYRCSQRVYSQPGICRNRSRLYLCNFDHMGLFLHLPCIHWCLHWRSVCHFRLLLYKQFLMHNREYIFQNLTWKTQNVNLTTACAVIHWEKVAIHATANVAAICIIAYLGAAIVSIRAFIDI